MAGSRYPGPAFMAVVNRCAITVLLIEFMNYDILLSVPVVLCTYFFRFTRSQQKQIQINSYMHAHAQNAKWIRVVVVFSCGAESVFIEGLLSS